MNDSVMEQVEKDIKDQINAALLRVEKLERQFGYSTDFLPPVDPNDTDALLVSLAKRVTWLEQFSGERPCPRA